MSLEDEALCPVLEAMLFAAGEPLELSRFAAALECGEAEVRSALAVLQKSLERENRGICLLRLGDSYQLCTKREYAPAIQKLLEIRRNTPLSPAAFEVLAVIAYNQPVTKAYIEQVRGVDCSGVVGTLCQRGLVEEKGRLDLPGRPLVYGTTPLFLKCFCLESLSELPEIPEREQKPDEPFEQLKMSEESEEE